MATIGLRELRQGASQVVRRVEDGEEITVTVAGRPSARLVPVSARRWRAWSDLEDLFAGPADTDWESDRDAIDHDAMRDPWLPR